MTRRRMLLLCIGCMITFALLFTSSPFNQMSSALAYGHSAKTPKTPDTGRLGANTQASPPKQSDWHPSKPDSKPGKSAPGKTAAHSDNTNGSGKGRKPGEQADMRTAFSKTFLNADGTWSQKTYSAPVHYKDGKGQWQDIDNTIVDDSSVTGYGLSNKASDWHAYFASASGGQTLMQVRFSGGSMSETLLGAKAVSAQKNGRQVAYSQVLPNTDLLYGLGAANLESTLLLHSVNAPVTYTFSYHVPGATATQEESGAIVFRDAGGKLLFAIGGTTMFEAKADGSLDPKGAGSDKVQVTLAGSAPDYTVTLTPDHAWLADSHRQFPVAIDPTFGPFVDNYNDWTDTFDESGHPTWGFYNTNSERIGNANAICGTCTGYGTGVDRSYIKMPIGSAPANSRVIKGTLWLYQTTAYAGGVQITANAVTSSWNSTTLTWNNHPTGFSYAGIGYASTSYNLWIDIDVTNAAYGWWQGGQPNYGLELQNTNESQGMNLFASADYGSNQPVLDIEYITDTRQGGGTISSITPTGSQYPDQLGHIYTNSSNVILNTQAADDSTTNEWNSNWSSINGAVGTNGTGLPNSAWSVDSGGTNLIADTSPCGTTQCWSQSYFTHNLTSMKAWPTFTAMFKTDSLTFFHFGVTSLNDNNTRFGVYSTTSGFNTLQVSTSAGSLTNISVNTLSMSANTWYYGQIDFPRPNVGEIFVWPAGQAKPTTPSFYYSGLYMVNPGLTFMMYGDNGANLHHAYIANVTMSTRSAYGADIGSPSLAGNEYLNNDTWTILANGSDIWGNSDQFHFAYQSQSGDMTLIARVTYLIGTADWTKAGVMFRTSADPASPHYFAFVSATQGLGAEWRASQGGASTVATMVAGGAPNWLKITRIGSTYSAYTSSNGTSWTLIPGSTVSLSLGNTVLTGLAATSTTTSRLTKATFDNVTLTGPTSLPGCPSAWRCTQGGYDNGYGAYGMQFSNNGSSFSCPAPAGGTVCVAAARQTGWALSSGDGQKTVSAKFGDNAGNWSQFAATNNTIILDTTPPNVSITSPASGREVRGVVTITGTAADPGAPADGSDSGMNTVTAYLDGSVAPMCSAVSGQANPTFLCDMTNVANGAHALTLVANDNLNNSRTSVPVQLLVNNAGQMGYETYATRTLPDGEHDVSVNVANGDGLLTHTDAHVGGRGPDLLISRTYNSLAPANNLFGWGWSSDLDEKVVANGDGSVTYRDPSGGSHVFLPNGSGGYLTPPGLYLALVKNANNTYTLTATDQSKTNFSTGGLVTSIVDRHGNTLTYGYGGNNLPNLVTDAAGRQITVTTSGGHVTGLSAPGSRTYSYTYDAGGNLVSFTEPSGTNPGTGRTTSYAYDGSHRLTQITLNYVSGGATNADTNVSTQLTYDTTNNHLLQLHDPMAFDVVISYAALGGYQTQVSQLKTNSTTTPSTGSSLYEVTLYSLTTDGMGTVSSIQGPVDDVTHKSQYQYDAQGNVTQITDANGHVSTATYDGNGNQLTQTIDPNGLNIQKLWTYDSANNTLTQTDPAPSGGQPVVTKYTYDSPASGNLLQVVQNYVSGGATTSSQNVTSSSTYDSYGEPLTATDPLGHVTQYTYDTYGDTTQTIANYVNGGGSTSDQNVTTSATYDTIGEQLTATDAKGVVSKSVYAIDGTVMQSIANFQQGATPDDHTNVTTSSGYDGLGRQVSTTNPKGIVSQSVYDANGRVTDTYDNCVNCLSGGAATSDQNVHTNKQYDAVGNLTLSTDANNNTTTTTFDAADRAIEVVVKKPVSGGGTAVVQDTATTFDRVGNKLSSQVKDGVNNPTTFYTYDAADRKATQTDPPASPGASDSSGKSNQTIYTYDAVGNVIDTKVVNDPVVQTLVTETQENPDALGRTLSKIDSVGTSAAQTTTFVYDANGRQSGHTEAAGTSSAKTTTTSYDNLGHVTNVLNPDGSVQVMTYDANGQALTQGNCGATGATGSVSIAYDALGRATTQTQKDCANNTQATTTNSYDANSNLLQRLTSYAGGNSTSFQYTYDHLDRQTGTNDAIRSYVLDSLGNVTQMTVAPSGSAPSAVSYTSTYDVGSRLSTLTAYGASLVPLHSYSFGYDQRGNRNSITVDGATTAYAYDGYNRLLSSQVGAQTPTMYTYDANHNRKTMVNAAGTTTYTYDASNTRLASKQDPNGKVTTYTYDSGAANGVGNLTSKTYDASGANQTTSYGYDTSNRLSSVTRPDGTVIAFTYDGQGQRTQKSVTPSGGSATLVNDTYQDGLLQYETNGSGTLLATFTYDAKGVPVSVKVGADPNTSPIYYYVYNGHGDVTELTDGQGNTVASYAYDDWGNITSSTGSFGNGWVNPYRYDGRDRVRYDEETGLYWMSVRAYDPALGRFLSHDPLGRLMSAGLDTTPYVYAGDNPVIHVDPSGMRFVDESGNPVIIQPTNKKKSGPCNPDARTASDHCIAVGVKAKRLRDGKTGGLQLSGWVKQAVGYGVILGVDAYMIAKGKINEKIEAGLDLGATVINSLLPLLAQIARHYFPQFNQLVSQVMQVTAVLNGAISLIQAGYGLYKSLPPWLRASAEAMLTAAFGLEAPVPTAATSLLSYLVPNLSNFLDAGAHALIAWGLSDYADYQYQQDMSIVSWCRKYASGAAECKDLFSASA